VSFFAGLLEGARGSDPMGDRAARLHCEAHEQHVQGDTTDRAGKYRGQCAGGTPAPPFPCSSLQLPALNAGRRSDGSQGAG